MAIDSALNQSGPFIHKILVSDDGSNDNTRDIIKRYVEKYPDIIVDASHDVNIGISGNYDSCISKLDGDYVFFLEGDDYWRSADKILKIIEFFDNNPGISMCFNEMVKDVNGIFEPGEFTGKISKEVLYTSDFFDYQLNPIINLSCCAFKCDELKAIPNIIFKNQFSEISLGLYFASKGGVGHIQDVINVYRIHDKGYWNGLSDQEKSINYYHTRHDALPIIEKKFKNRLKRYLYINFYADAEFLNSLADVESIPDKARFVVHEVGLFNLLMIKLFHIIKHS